MLQGPALCSRRDVEQRIGESIQFYPVVSGVVTRFCVGPRYTGLRIPCESSLTVRLVDFGLCG
jgi:hypothetical protein